MNERLAQLRTISNRLVWVLGVLVAIGIPGSLLAYRMTDGHQIPTPMAVFFVGFVGGFVGLQRRLKTLCDDDLTLLANSWVGIVLSPMVGAILAELLYLIFISGLLQGNLFPRFVDDFPGPTNHALRTLYEVHCEAPADYAKILFWSFVAGFSEKFVTNVIGQFEGKEAQQEPPPELEDAQDVPPVPTHVSGPA